MVTIVRRILSKINFERYNNHCIVEYLHFSIVRKFSQLSLETSPKMFFPWSFRFLRFLPFKVWLWNFWNYKEKVLGGTKNSKFWKYHFLFIGLWTLSFFYWKEYWMNEWMIRILENPDITVFIVLLFNEIFVFLYKAVLFSWTAAICILKLFLSINIAILVLREKMASQIVHTKGSVLVFSCTDEMCFFKSTFRKDL